MIENIKNLVSEMDSKSEFVQKVADYYKVSYIYILQNWFQNKWKIPKDNLLKILEMAQLTLFEQNNRKTDILIETGFDIDVKESEVIK